MASKGQPIIVIKKKGGHGGHHGGAWKVAYADFVTAMMSLFIVLWLMGSSEKVKKAVAGYFQDPKGTGQLLGTTMSGTGEAIKEASTDQLEQLKKKIEEEIKARKDLEQLSKQIEIKVTPEGLRIELLEGKNGTFYELGSARLSANGQALLGLLAGELKKLPNHMLIEGHTDAIKYSSDASYSNWELSADRANAARRLMQEDGVREDQVTQIRGYADQFLRVKDNPTDPSNRRISILVKNEEEQVHVFSADQVVKGQSPLNQKDAPAATLAGKEAPKAGGKDEGKGAPKAGEKKPAETAKPPESKPAETKPAEAPKQPENKAAPPKPAASPASAAKPSLIDKIKAMLPGKKK